MAGNRTWIGDFSSMRKLQVHTFLENLDHKSIPISCEISNHGVYIRLRMGLLFENFHVLLKHNALTIHYKNPCLPKVKLFCFQFLIHNEEDQGWTTQYKKLTFQEKNLEKVWRMCITWPMMSMRCVFFFCSPIAESSLMCSSSIIDSDKSFFLYFELVQLCMHLLLCCHNLVLSILELCI